MNKVIRSKTTLLFFIISFFTSTAIAQAPIINTFSPVSGTTGSSITISGSNFDPAAANNIVFFGAVKADVITASTTSLAVNVPAGATHQPISVTCNGFTAFSSLSFNLVFDNGSPITGNSFPYATGTGELIPVSAKTFKTSDLDGDGKPDMVILSRDDSIAVCRNSSTGTNLSIAKKISFHIGFGVADISIADYDGDGKPDLATVSGTNQIKILRNTSSPGSISFQSPVVVTITATQPRSIVSGDVDGDGLIDLVVSSRADSSVFIFKNSTAGTNISFAAGVSYRTGKQPVAVALADLDGDLKPEIITANYQSNTLSILKNSSGVNSISFDPKIDNATGPEPNYISIADLDGDLKNDIVIANGANGASNTISSFLNNSNVGNISFAPKTDHIVTTEPNAYPKCVSAGDVDGDGKVDVVVGCLRGMIYPDGDMVLLKNNGTPGNISFAGKITYPTTEPVYSIFLCDMQGDSKPEILAVSRSDISTLYDIYQNKIGDPVDIVLCPPIANTVIYSTLTGSDYQWQVSTDSVTFTNISNTGYYSGSQSASLQLTNIPSAAYGNLYRCLVDTAYSELYRLIFRNQWSWNHASHVNWEDASGWSCGTLPDSNTDVIITSGASIKLNSNTTIRSLYISPGGTLTIRPGYNLTVLH